MKTLKRRIKRNWKMLLSYLAAIMLVIGTMPLILEVLVT